MTEIATMSGIELLKAYRNKVLSPVEVAKDTLARIDAAEPAINAFTLIDHEGVLQAAKASEARWHKGAPQGLLDGVGVTIKDNLNVKDWPNRRGSAVTPTTPSDSDAPAVARLREAGAILLGKTTMPEFGWKGVGDSPLTGISRNPWNTSRNPGGSTAGGAATAALNLGVIHIGTDGAGSIRIPAAFCGVFGIKASYGRVPASPVSTMGFLAHVGPLSRTVEDSALALSVIGQPDSRDMTAQTTPPPDYRASLNDGLRGLRIAWSPRLGYVDKVDPDVARLTEQAARAFAALGAHVEEADPDFTDPLAPLMTLWQAGCTLALKQFSPEQRAKMDPGLIAVAKDGERLSGADYADALLYGRNALAHKMAQFHEKYDLLLTPSLALPAFEAGRNVPADPSWGEDWTRWTPFTYPFNLTMQPAATVPCGLSHDGMPIGLQIVGPMNADALVLRAAKAFEAAHPFLRVDQPIIKKS
ncbi:MAG: amidase [Rhizobiales bacterium]|jgi:aspartyl-tRNA(Asn)/glutamyl-tRNA(Gln) amidotransferase subunit A|nr:amidase [Hyphomicrobiales bacterium]